MEQITLRAAPRVSPNAAQLASINAISLVQVHADDVQLRTIRVESQDLDPRLAPGKGVYVARTPVGRVLEIHAMDDDGDDVLIFVPTRGRCADLLAAVDAGRASLSFDAPPIEELNKGLDVSARPQWGAAH